MTMPGDRAWAAMAPAARSTGPGIPACRRWRARRPARGAPAGPRPRTRRWRRAGRPRPRRDRASTARVSARSSRSASRTRLPHDSTASGPSQACPPGRRDQPAERDRADHGAERAGREDQAGGHGQRQPGVQAGRVAVPPGPWARCRTPPASRTGPACAAGRGRTPAAPRPPSRPARSRPSPGRAAAGRRRTPSWSSSADAANVAESRLSAPARVQAATMTPPSAKPATMPVCRAVWLTPPRRARTARRSACRAAGPSGPP